MNIKVILFVIIFLISTACAALIWNHYELKKELLTAKQNSQFVIDSLNTKADSIQTLAVRVSKLKQASDSMYTGIIINQEQVIRRLRASGSAATTVYVDSTNDTSYTVNFSGDTSIVKFSGKTVAYADTTKPAQWDLDLEFDTLRTTSELVFDKDDDLWKIRTISQTPGLLLRGFGDVDQKLFSKISDIPFDRPHVFYVGGHADWKTLAPGVALRVGNNLYEVSYIVLGEGSSWLERIRLSFMKGIF
jgi:hypothetical protein